jgi:hypothetical protein
VFVRGEGAAGAAGRRADCGRDSEREGERKRERERERERERMRERERERMRERGRARASEGEKEPDSSLSDGNPVTPRATVPPNHLQAL